MSKGVTGSAAPVIAEGAATVRSDGGFGTRDKRKTAGLANTYARNDAFQAAL
jgi:hypothetical protein